MQRKMIPETRLIELKKSLDILPPRSAERKSMVREFGELYGVSSSSVYRALRRRWRPKGLRRSDAGSSRVMPAAEMEKYCQIIAAMKIRTRNKKGRHLPTTEAIRLIEQFGIETAQGLVKASEGALKKTTVNRYLKSWGYDLRSLDVEPVAVRF
jgi:transposase